MNIRIIPRLDIKGPNLVKGIHLEGLRVLGLPQEFAKFYYNNGADELFFQDTVASLYERNNISEIITKTAENIFIPLTVGGGIRTIEDINDILRAGADKVAINTAATKDPDFIKEACKTYGSSTIVVAIEVIKQMDGTYHIFTDNGREQTGIDAISWAKKMEDLGAGELLLTSIDKEGTGDGFDIEFVEKVSSAVRIPIIAHGGPSKIKHILNLLKNTSVNGIALSSMLHYSTIDSLAFKGKFKTEGNTEFIKKGNLLKCLENLL